MNTSLKFNKMKRVTIALLAVLAIKPMGAFSAPIPTPGHAALTAVPTSDHNSIHFPSTSGAEDVNEDLARPPQAHRRGLLDFLTEAMEASGSPATVAPPKDSEVKIPGEGIPVEDGADLISPIEPDPSGPVLELIPKSP